jgi:hypothetical protein
MFIERVAIEFVPEDEGPRAHIGGFPRGLRVRRFGGMRGEQQARDEQAAGSTVQGASMGEG